MRIVGHPKIEKEVASDKDSYLDLSNQKILNLSIWLTYKSFFVDNLHP